MYFVYLLSVCRVVGPLPSPDTLNYRAWQDQQIKFRYKLASRMFASVYVTWQSERRHQNFRWHVLSYLIIRRVTFLSNSEDFAYRRWRWRNVRAFRLLGQRKWTTKHRVTSIREQNNFNTPKFGEFLQNILSHLFTDRRRLASCTARAFS